MVVRRRAVRRRLHVAEHAEAEVLVLVERAPAFRAARTIRQLAGPGMTELFPPGSEGGGSKALPAVWTDWPGFEAYAGRLYLNGSFLVRAAQAADTGTDLREALASVTEVCRACHARYLAKK